MKTAAEHVQVRRIEEDHGSRPDPGLSQWWSPLHKLRWKAALIMFEHPGVDLYVEHGKSWTNGIFNFGRFTLSWNHGAMSPITYDQMWDVLNGIDLGLRIAERLAATQNVGIPAPQLSEGSES